MRHTNKNANGTIAGAEKLVSRNTNKKKKGRSTYEIEFDVLEQTSQGKKLLGSCYKLNFGALIKQSNSHKRAVLDYLRKVHFIITAPFSLGLGKIQNP